MRHRSSSLIIIGAVFLPYCLSASFFQKKEQTKQLGTPNPFSQHGSPTFGKVTPPTPESPIKVKLIEQAVMDFVLGEEITSLLAELEAPTTSPNKRKEICSLLRKEIYFKVTANKTFLPGVGDEVKSVGDEAKKDTHETPRIVGNDDNIRETKDEALSSFSERWNALMSELQQLPTFDKVTAPDKSDVRFKVLHSIEHALFCPTYYGEKVDAFTVGLDLTWGELVIYTISQNTDLVTLEKTISPFESFVNPESIAGSWIKFLGEYQTLLLKTGQLILAYAEDKENQKRYLKRIKKLIEMCSLLREFAFKKAFSHEYQQVHREIRKQCATN